MEIEKGEALSEKEVKEILIELKNLHNSMTQQIYKLRERITSYQTLLLQKQRKRIMKDQFSSINTTELEKQTGLSREEILRGIVLMKKEERKPD